MKRQGSFDHICQSKSRDRRIESESRVSWEGLISRTVTSKSETFEFVVDRKNDGICCMSLQHFDKTYLPIVKQINDFENRINCWFAADGYYHARLLFIAQFIVFVYTNSRFCKSAMKQKHFLIHFQFTFVSKMENEKSFHLIVPRERSKIFYVHTVVERNSCNRLRFSLGLIFVCPFIVSVCHFVLCNLFFSLCLFFLTKLQTPSH